ncbi:uncharacterized protein LOC124462012 [Drosophila willistoni]|uniref:uncharacterized protein LOC124462012 n=1 Tax=Drosophila willistoni TaxID=7260 RepID=UPI001F0751BD|nr:uncharacterized protein LOC124462012 [Drosophila willistoni]
MVTHSAVRDTWHYDHEAPQLPFLTSNNTRATTREQPHLSATPMAPWNFTNTQNRAASYYPESKVRMDIDLNTAIPSAAQLAARQAIPKELPTFDGNPQNWPLFYSSFQTSTEIAGYTNAENLMRLQASLKGKAHEGSALTLIDNKVFKQLGLKGVPDPLCLKWTNDTTREENASERVTLSVANPHNGNQFYLEEVHSVDTLDLPHHTPTHAQALIGINNWYLAVPLKIKEGAWHQPIASKTRLGWALQSSTPSRATRANVSVHMCSCRDADAKLHEIIKQAFSLDATTAKPLSSPEESQALTRLESTTALKNGRYEVGLMWKDPEVLLPDSYANALKRLKCQQKQFSRQPQLKEQITKQIENLVEKGYARMLTPEEIAAPNRWTWYLPTFITKNPNKPEKVRLVWDAAAQSGGKALNDYIWSGPDLLNSLFDLLLSFRVGRVAICGDIAEMFHQIRVRPADTHAQRFLWFDSKSERQEPNVYVMEALTFGINCAPCIAHFIRDKNADRFCQQYPQAAQAMNDYHYVDDFIYSGDVEVGNIATQVRDIHAAGGFHIRNWSSNSKEVLRILKSDSLLPEAAEITATEKVLGLYWMPNSDVFTFICKFARLKRNVLDSDKTPTKRELLQVLMSMYDPLGFISCFTIELKILLQEVWRSGIGWDTGLPDALLPKWIRWKRILTTIAGLTIPRCYFISSDQIHDVQLHMFVDASELAYAAVCYLRIRQWERTYLSFVASKAKVAPLSPLSIPRMELQAAVIGARLSNRIQRNPSLSINSSCYWSDSKTVLKWLRMDPRKFQQFVMHRVGEILEFTNVSQWNWVPTNLNPADLATKTNNANKYKTWLHGPDYLLQDQHEWPKCDDLGPPNNAEVRHNILFIDNSPMELKLNAEYFSDWRTNSRERRSESEKRSLAAVSLRIKNNSVCHRSQNDEHMSVSLPFSTGRWGIAGDMSLVRWDNLAPLKLQRHLTLHVLAFKTGTTTYSCRYSCRSSR